MGKKKIIIAAFLLSLNILLNAQTFTWVGYPTNSATWNPSSTFNVTTATAGGGSFDRRASSAAGTSPISSTAGNIAQNCANYTGLRLEMSGAGNGSGTGAWNNSITVTMTFPTYLCAPVTFNIYDVTETYFNDGSFNYVYYQDKVSISATDNNNAAVLPTATTSGSVNNNVVGSTRVIIANGTSAQCANQAITVGSAGQLIKTITVVYANQDPPTNCPAPVGSPARYGVSQYQYIFISPITGNPAPSATISGSLACGSSTTTLTATTSASSPTYSWAGPGGSTIVSPNAASTSVTGVGTYTVTVTSGGCSGTATTTLTAPAAPSAPLSSSITQPTCVTTTGSVNLTGLPASGTWTINPGGYTGTGTTTTISGLSSGTYNFTVTNSGGCTSAASTDITINPGPTNPSAAIVGTVTQPTCATSTGSIALSGLPASGTWTLNPGGITGTGTTTTVSGLTAGTYSYTVTNSSGCTSPAATATVINAAPTTPTAAIVGTVTQPTCATATGSIALSGLPASGTWTLNPGGITGTGTTTTISGLNTGTYNYTVTNAAGCTSSASANATINTQPATPSAAIIGTVTQPTCAITTGSIALSGLPASGTWTLNPGGLTGSGTTTTVSGLTAGTYNYTVTNSSGCTSPAATATVINAAPTIPTAAIIGTVTQPTCVTATGSIALSGLPASGTWTLNPGGITGTGTTTTISGLNAGTYNYTVTNASGCTSSASANATINSQPTTPSAAIVGAVTQPTCATATGSIALSGLPASGTWTLNPGGVTGSGTTTTISGLTAGTYSYTVTNSSGCTSPAATATTITAAPSSPSAPTVGSTTQTNCASSTGSVNISGLPASGTWTINPGGITGTGTTTTISGLNPGTYNLTVTNSSGCTSSASSSIVINAQPSNPSSPLAGVVVQPNCSVATGSINLTGLPATGTWTINPGNITGTGTTTTISGLTSGTYNYTVTNSSGCSSTASTDIVIQAQPTTPSTPLSAIVAQPNCSVGTGTVDLSGLPASGAWTINPGNISGTGTTTTISGLASGTYNFTVTNADGCTSTPTANIVINNFPSTPIAPTANVSSQPSCSVSTGDIILSGLPATGTWTINPGNITGTGTTTSITGLVAGTYNYTVTNSDGCTSPASVNAIINTQPTTPNAPLTTNTIQPTCSTSTGSVDLSGLPASGTWTINPGNITGTGTTTTISNLSSGTYNYTVTNVDGCTSGLSSNITINAQPTTPTAPLTSNVMQPSCTVATGSVDLNGLPATGNWTINPGNVSGSGSSITINNLAPGTYNYTVTNSDGCISSASVNVVITASPSTPSAPLTSVNSQPDCNNATGTIDISGLPSTGTWTINPGNITGTGTTTSISNLTAGTYNYTVTNSLGCSSPLSSSITINTQPVTPTAPVVSSTNQPTCFVSTGDITLTGLPTSGSWTLNPGSISGTGNSTTITGLNSGTYNYTVTNSDGCTSSATVNVTINPQPTTPNPPVVTASNALTFCQGDSVVLSVSPGTGIVWLPNNSTDSVISINSSGTYVANYTATNGCSSASAPITVTVNSNPTAPSINIAGGTSTLCQGQSVTLVANPSNGITWLPNGQTSSSISVNTSGTYSAMITDVNQCVSPIASINVTVNPLPNIDITSAIIDTVHCNLSNGGINNVLVNGGTQPYSYEWFDSSNNLIGTNNSVSNINSGAYYIVVTDSLGCRDTSSNISLPSVGGVNVTLSGTPLSGAEPLDVLLNANTNTSVNNYNWFLNNSPIGTTPGNTFNLTGLTYGSYVAQVTVSDSYGCLDTAQITINVDATIDIVIPNVFTPNGDNLNDVFEIKTKGIESIEGKIFNRWGQLIFSWNSLNAVWDGKMINGEIASEGTYYYIIDYTDINKQTHNKTGYIELLH